MPTISIAALDSLPQTLHQVISNAPLPSLGVDSPDTTCSQFAAKHLRLGLEDSVTPMAVELCRSGIWMLAGDLDRSHAISQGIDSPEGSFWHGIMHRREGDFSNAKYWFRRVGSHEVFQQIAQHADDLPARLLAHDKFDPFTFVDACQSVGKNAKQESQYQALQWLEWQCLFAACLAK